MKPFPPMLSSRKKKSWKWNSGRSEKACKTGGWRRERERGRAGGDAEGGRERWDGIGWESACQWCFGNVVAVLNFTLKVVPFSTQYTFYQSSVLVQLARV